MQRFFRLKNTKSIIFTDGLRSNITYNEQYKYWGDCKWYTYLNIPTHFFRKAGIIIEEVKLSNVKYSCWQEIESTETILNTFTMIDLEEITEDLAKELLRYETLDFSTLFDKEVLWKD